MKFSDMPIGVWFTLVDFPNWSFYRRSQTHYIEVTVFRNVYEIDSSLHLFNRVVEDYEVMGEVNTAYSKSEVDYLDERALFDDVENRSGVAVVECTKESCPDIFKGHSVGCRYFK